MSSLNPYLRRAALAVALPVGLFAQSNYSLTVLPGLFGLQMTPYDINSSGQVVGEVANSSGPIYRYGVLWSGGGTVTDLGGFGGTATWARAINDAGTIAGFSDTGGAGNTPTFIREAA